MTLLDLFSSRVVARWCQAWLIHDMCRRHRRPNDYSEIIEAGMHTSIFHRQLTNYSNHSYCWHSANMYSLVFSWPGSISFAVYIAGLFLHDLVLSHSLSTSLGLFLHDLVLSHSLSTLLVSSFMTWFYLIRCLHRWSLPSWPGSISFAVYIARSLPSWPGSISFSVYLTRFFLHDLVLSHFVYLARFFLHDLVSSHSLFTSLVSSFKTWFYLIRCLHQRVSSFVTWFHLILCPVIFVPLSWISPAYAPLTRNSFHTWGIV